MERSTILTTKKARHLLLNNGESVPGQPIQHQNGSVDETSIGIKPSDVKQIGVFYTVIDESKGDFSSHKIVLNNGEKISGKPIQLIIPENGRLTINNEALDIIRRIQGKIAVCSVVGPYRTGKSYILNRLLNRKDGFEIGAKNISCTRGIWMWDTPVKHKNKHDEFYLLFLDTEGLESTDSTPELDNMIFVVSLLLSSLFIYNTKNVIDREAVRKLGTIVDLSKHIREDSTEKNKGKLDSPDFIWVVRDVFLENNFRCTKKYLNASLNLECNSQISNESKFISGSIRECFKSFECLLLPMPINCGIGNKNIDQTLRNMQEVDWNHLRNDFKFLITGLVYKILDSVSSKTLQGKPVSAAIFAGYIESVVRQVNENKQVKLVDSMIASIEYASKKALDDALDMYDKKIEQLVARNPLPVEWHSLEKAHEEIVSKCLKVFEQDLKGQDEQTKPYFDKFNEYVSVCEGSKVVGGKYFLLRKDNSEQIKKFYKNILNTLWNKLINESKANKSENAYLEFSKQLEQLEFSYNSETRFSSSTEKIEAFNEWHKDKGIDNVKEDMSKLSEQRKARIESEKKYIEAKSLREKAQQEKTEHLSQLEASKAASEAIFKETIKSQQEEIARLQRNC